MNLIWDWIASESWSFLDNLNFWKWLYEMSRLRIHLITLIYTKLQNSKKANKKKENKLPWYASHIRMLLYFNFFLSREVRCPFLEQDMCLQVVQDFNLKVTFLEIDATLKADIFFFNAIETLNFRAGQNSRMTKILPFLDHEKFPTDDYFPGMREIVSYQFLQKKKWKRIFGVTPARQYQKMTDRSFIGMIGTGVYSLGSSSTFTKKIATNWYQRPTTCLTTFTQLNMIVKIMNPTRNHHLGFC